jgi:uncharacterized protein
VPEALAVIEQVSGRLGPLVADHVPLGNRLTVRQLFAVYQWHLLAGVAVKAYDLWRIIRLINPAAALANEVRERIAGQVIDHGREELAKRLLRAYVETVGRAAIDLYSGRLVPGIASGPLPFEQCGDAAQLSAVRAGLPPAPNPKGRSLRRQVRNAASALLRKS